jgi:hypothetical protein
LSFCIGLMKLSWNEIHGIMERAVKRGLERRKAELVTPAREYRRHLPNRIPKGRHFLLLLSRYGLPGETRYHGGSN